MQDKLGMVLVIYEMQIFKKKIKIVFFVIDFYLNILLKYRFVKFLMDNIYEYSFQKKDNLKIFIFVRNVVLLIFVIDKDVQRIVSYIIYYLRENI